MTTQAMAKTSAPRRTGRPPKQTGAVPTKDRVIAAAVEVCTEDGYSNATITDIAARAGISGPAVYKHFDGKADVLMQAARRSLEQVSGTTRNGAPSPIALARRWLSPDFAQTRRLHLELHLAAQRDDDLAALLTQWHIEQANAWQATSTDDIDQVKAFYLLLLGLSQVDVLAGLDADPGLLQEQVDQMVAAVFPDSPDRS